MSNIKKFIDIVNEAGEFEDPLNAPRQDQREGSIRDLRKQIFGYLNDAQEAIDAGNGDQAKEYIGYVIELVDDNI